jgi:hypothetical protein
VRALVPLLLAGVVATGCGGEESAPAPSPPAQAASPQTASLEWSERFTQAGNSFTFRVSSFEILDSGWEARISMTNGTSTRFELATAGSTVDRYFGVMLFRTGELSELEERGTQAELPGIRRAERFRPALPLVLEPGATWSGTIGASGALPAGLWVRIVFGVLVPVGDPPQGFPSRLLWITDHAHRLE